MLSYQDIIKVVELGEVKIEPFNKSMVQPASIDLRLGTSFFDVVMQEEADMYKDFKDEYVINTQDFILGTTIERIELGNFYAAQVNGKSSLGRLGLMVHSTAGFIDPGFKGEITLELKNIGHNPIKLTPGMKIAQLHLFRLTSRTERMYGDPRLGSHYQNQSGATPSWMS